MYFKTTHNGDNLTITAILNQGDFVNSCIADIMRQIRDKIAAMAADELAPLIMKSLDTPETIQKIAEDTIAEITQTAVRKLFND